jgi:hypothetical protein
MPRFLLVSTKEYYLDSDAVMAGKTRADIAAMQSEFTASSAQIGIDAVRYHIAAKGLLNGALQLAFLPAQPAFDESTQLPEALQEHRIHQERKVGNYIAIILRRDRLASEGGVAKAWLGLKGGINDPNRNGLYTLHPAGISELEDRIITQSPSDEQNTAPPLAMTP